MKNLISMTDYCQELSSEFMSPKKPFDKNYWFSKILNYSDFLKQPLELWMFVPCDKYGNVVEFDENEEKYTKYHIEKYQQAKESCVFEGFEMYCNNACTNNEISVVFTKSGGILLDRNYETYVENIGTITLIEDLVTYKLQLTQTAIKQLGL